MVCLLASFLTTCARFFSLHVGSRSWKRALSAYYIDTTTLSLSSLVFSSSLLLFLSLPPILPLALSRVSHTHSFFLLRSLSLPPPLFPRFLSFFLSFSRSVESKYAVIPLIHTRPHQQTNSHTHTHKHTHPHTQPGGPESQTGEWQFQLHTNTHTKTNTQTKP